MNKNGKDSITAFFSEIETDIAYDPFYPESRIDKFRAAIHNMMVKEKIYRNPALDRNLMIERLGINKNLFVDMFKECFSISFWQFVNALRLKESAKLLEQSDILIEEISMKVGFGTVRTFQRLFMEEYKMTPKEYRKSKRSVTN